MNGERTKLPCEEIESLFGNMHWGILTAMERKLTDCASWNERLVTYPLNRE